LEIQAQTPEAVFLEALRALGELLGAGGPGEQIRRPSRAEGSDRAALLAAWIDELVYLAETEDLVPEDVETIELSERELQATVCGYRGSPRHLVKGATYHELMFERSRSGYHATVVLDV